MDIKPWLELAVAIIMIASFWKIYDKAGQPGWTSIIPIYNLYILMKILGRSGWLLLLFFVPLVNLCAWIWAMWELGGCFGRGPGFRIGLALLGVIFAPLLAFGPDSYQGPTATTVAA